ncbi:EpsG family protein [Epilithonimonas caeni]|uniref:EpsG family protein n=1 Tax=Epilithonimonas caeni TaxID=365343 RepID=UPI0003FEE94F|nr:EpsG family protein [Epilithonimonas caeni]
MFDWIPIEYYTVTHYHVLLLVALFIVFNSLIFDVSDKQSIRIFGPLGYFIVLVLILYMGLRPINVHYFGDTSTYAGIFKAMRNGQEAKIQKDYVFNYFMKWCSNFMDVHRFFLLLDILYIIPSLLFSRKYFGQYWFFAMFMFIGSFSFWAYGTNGLRNGLATSLFILGLYFYNRKVIMYMIFTLGYFMHASLIIPIAAFVVSGIYKNPKVYLYIWFASIPLSLVGGSAWTTLFAGLGFEDRTSGYLTNAEGNLEQFSQTGFRWDFLLYSASAVFIGWYFIFKKQIVDRFYIHIFGVYTIANSFWILVITAAFSNRFAYLSWFLMPAVFIYPMFRYKIWKDQYKTFAIILFSYFMFTYFMNVIKER